LRVNARVGSDCETYAGIIGKFGKGKKNINGDLLDKSDEHFRQTAR